MAQWIDRSQPQTLQSAVLLSYVTAAMNLVYLATGAPLWLFLAPGIGVAAYFVAHEHRVAYVAAVILTGILLLAQAVLVVFGTFGTVIPLLFTAALLALFLHPHSREYQRVWFH